MALLLLQLCIGLAAAAPSAEEQAAITQINVRRGQVGLPPLTHNANLEQSARGHANYLAVNNCTGHFQRTPPCPEEANEVPGSFTGITALDRITLTYGSHVVSNEVISFGPSTGVAAIESLIQAIYHRFAIFSSRVNETGVGRFTSHPTFGTVFVVNSALKFDTPPGPGGDWVGVYPYDGQTGVPRSFLSDTESPDPVPSTNKVGYPISVHVEDDKTLAVTSFTITKVAGAIAVPAQLLAPGDPNVPLSAAALIPNAPLEYGTEYEIQFSGTADGTTPVTRTWRFTTELLLPITFSPAQPYLAHNSTLDIEISGGSGVFSPPGGAQIQYVPPLPADFAFVGPRTLRFTSPAASVGVAVSGSITLTVTDDEGNMGQVVIQVQPTVDSTPDPFSFPAVTGAAVSSVVQSAQVPITGINVPTAIAVLGGEYSINGGAYTSQAGSVVNGNTVRVRLTSAPLGNTTTSATVTIGDVSAIFSVTTLDLAAPSQPTGLAISNLGANSLTLSWNASGDVGGGVTAYRVFRNGAFRATVTAPAVSFDDSGLTAATPYSYTVAACDAAGNCSAQSLSISATTLDNLPPLSPSGLGITNLAANSLTLSWSASTDNVGVTDYRVLRSGVFRATVTAPTLSFNDSGLAAATLYSYTVAACDVAGNCSAPSSSVSATTLDNLPPSAPAGLGITNLTANTLTLNWLAANDNVAVTAYRVFRDGAFRATVTGATSFNDSGLTTVTSYSYTVAACDAAGNCSAQSAAIPATTLDNIAPAPPASLTATAVSGTQIDLAWAGATDNVGVTAYGVYRGGVFRATVNAPATGFSDTTLVNATAYSYTVRACDAAGNCSAQSAAAFAATPDTQAPSVPAGLTATVVNDTRITLAWNASGDNVGVSAYQVFRGGIFRATVLAPAVSFGDTGLSASTGYIYTVTACDAAGNCSAPSGSAGATTLTAGNDSVTPVFRRGWNLAGNGLELTLNAAAVFGSPGAPVTGVTTHVNSIWKWNATLGMWQFYAPGLTAQDNQTYADNNGFEVLTTIEPGMGYWVNVANSAPVNGIALATQTGARVAFEAANSTSGAPAKIAGRNLVPGWQLVALADALTPSQFNEDISGTPAQSGVVKLSFQTLWAWDAALGAWYFYAPQLHKDGVEQNLGLTLVQQYAQDNGFLHFEDYDKTLDVGVGFWIRK